MPVCVLRAICQLPTYKEYLILFTAITTSFIIVIIIIIIVGSISLPVALLCHISGGTIIDHCSCIKAGESLLFPHLLATIFLIVVIDVVVAVFDRFQCTEPSCHASGHHTLVALVHILVVFFWSVQDIVFFIFIHLLMLILLFVATEIHS